MKVLSECHCINVSFGDYTNTVLMLAPFDVYNSLGEKKESNWICVDTCIATAIGYLWHQGIVTLNSCCGHKTLSASVIVDLNSIEKMKKLGYKNDTISRSTVPEQTFLLSPNPSPKDM